MGAPAVTEFSARWWARLPALYRAADEAQADGDNGYPLLRFLSLVGDQAGEVEALVDRIALHDDGTGDCISDLGNPATADAAWIPWLAQMAGLGIHVGSGTAETFDQLVIDYATFDEMAADNASFRALRFHASSVPGGESGPDAARTALLDTTGARHSASTSAWERLITPYLTGAARVLHRRVFGGDAWHLRLETYAVETPSPAIVAAVIDRATKAAGLVVSYQTRSGSSFADVEAGFADFDDIVATLPTFSALTAWLP